MAGKLSFMGLIIWNILGIPNTYLQPNPISFMPRLVFIITITMSILLITIIIIIIVNLIIFSSAFVKDILFAVLCHRACFAVLSFSPIMTKHDKYIFNWDTK